MRKGKVVLWCKNGDSNRVCVCVLRGSTLPIENAPPTSLLSGPRAFSECTENDVCKVTIPSSRDNTFLCAREQLLYGRKGGVPMIYQ